MKKIIYLTSLLLSVFTIHLPSQTWVSFDNTYCIKQPPLIEVLSSDAMQYKFRITIYGYNKDTIFENDTLYSKISISDWHTLNNVGEPTLPTFTQFIGLPANHEYTVSISDTEWITMPTEKIYPAQELREESDTTEIEFVINDSIYNSLDYQINLYGIGEKACIGGMYGIPLSVTPFKYHPTKNRIEIMKKFTVTVNFSQSSIFDGTLSIKNRNLLKGIVANYNTELINTYNIPLSDNFNTNNYDYLIITSDKYKDTDALKEFCAWKKIKGHNCKVISCSEIGGNKSDSIKVCIKNWYNKGVEYVLFVGNHEELPAYKYLVEGVGIIIYSDYWYACVDDVDIKENTEYGAPPPVPPVFEDYYADVSFGRFPIISVKDLENIVSKTINYENLTPEDTWVTKNLLVAHKQDAPGKYQGCSEEIKTAQYDDMPCFTTAYGAPDSLGGDDATNDMVVSYINDGFGIVNYRGHGVVTGWDCKWNHQNLEFDYDYVNKLSNKYTPIVFSIACMTGNIADNTTPPFEKVLTYNYPFYNNSLLYNFMASKFGSVAFIGASEDTNTKFNDLYSKFIYRLLYNNFIYKIGLLNVSARINTIYSDASKYISKLDGFAYICGGDPSLEIWTDTISKFPDIDISFENNVLYINTRTIENYTVTLFSQTDSSYFKKIVVDGTSTTIENLPLSFVLSLNKHNYMPLVYNISDGDIYIQNENYALVRDIIGNNIYIGSDVVNSMPNGNVTIKSGAELNINAKGKTIIKNGFTIEKGAKVFIK